MMFEARSRVYGVLLCIFCQCITALTAGCGVDEKWVKSYVGQELEPLKEGQYKPLEDSLAQTRAQLELLQKEEEEVKKAVGSKTLESTEQILKEHTEELRWLQEDLDGMHTRLTALESAVQIPVGGEDVLRPMPRSTPAEVRPLVVEAPVTQPLKSEDPAVLAEELRKLHSRVNEVSRQIEHVDQKYQEDHKYVGGLRVAVMNDIDALEGKITVLDEKVSALKDTQREMLAEMGKQPQKDVESLEQKFRGLIENLPK